MIRIEGDRKAFYQWDLNQRVVLMDIKPGVQVHFSDESVANSECLYLFSYEEDGKVYANVPNILLQTNGTISVYIYVQEEGKAYTTHYAEFLVVKRPKPADYVYTETEVITWTSFNERVGKIEENIGTVCFFGNELHNGKSIDLDAIISSPIYGSVDENKVIILNGNLKAGTYTVKYILSNGLEVGVGTIEVI